MLTESMMPEELQSLAATLVDRTIIRVDAIDAWVSLALEQPEPGEWVGAIVAAALDRLSAMPQSRTVKAEARRQLLDIQRAMHAGVARSRPAVE